jgi:transcription antitermination factor NusG
MKTKKTFAVGQTITFVAGPFKGLTGTVQFVGESGRVFVNIKGSRPDANGRMKKLKGTFAEATDIE